MDNKRNKQISNKETNVPTKLSYSIDANRDLNLSTLEQNKPVFNKENNKYSLISFLSSKRKPDVYLNDSVIKARQYKIKSVKEESESDVDMTRFQQRYFKTNITMKCYNCGEVGHMSRNCALDEIIICTKCNETGHESFNCKNMKCFKCNKMGHKSSECTLKDVKRCKKCENNGHTVTDCLVKSSRVTENDVIKVCRFCGKNGHLVCPFPSKIYIIDEYDSDTVILSDDERGKERDIGSEHRISLKKLINKICPRCGENHLLERCKVNPGGNTYDKARELFKGKDNDMIINFSKNDYSSESEESFSNFRRKSNKVEDFRFNLFK
jgi:hypothetical protein